MMYNPQERTSRSMRRIISRHIVFRPHSKHQASAEQLNDGSNVDKNKIPNVTNIILAFVGVIGVFFSAWQGFNTQRSLDQADTAAARLKIKDLQADIKDQKKFYLESLSVEEQINAFRETSKRFQIENQAFLSITDIELKDDKPNKTMTIEFTIANEGKYLARVNDYTVACDIADEVKVSALPSLLKDKKKTVFKYVNSITSENKLLHTGEDFTIDKQHLSDALKAGKALFFYGKINYTNLASGKPRVYTFLVSKTELTGAQSHRIYDQNTRL